MSVKRLVLAAVLVLAAGCSGGSDTDDAAPELPARTPTPTASSPTRSPSPTATATATPRVTPTAAPATPAAKPVAKPAVRPTATTAPKPAAKPAPAPAPAPPKPQPAPTTTAPKPRPTPAPEPAREELTIRGFAFSPAAMTIAVGTTVRVTNADDAGHDWVADNGAFRSPVLAKGQSYSYTFTRAGTYSYYCSLHPSMTGTITVR